MNPEVIYADRNVTVSKQIATIFGTSYPIRAISSLTIRRRQPASGCIPFVLMLTGILLAFGGAIGVAAALNTISVGLLFMAGFVTLFGISMIMRAVYYKHPEPEFDLILVTMAAQRVAMTSRDPGYVNHVRAAIEQAILEQ